MSTTVPRPEYPRPDRDRSHDWRTLNGRWDFVADPIGTLGYDEASTVATTEHVVVPFAWETPASGVERTWLETAWYRRDLDVPAEWRDRRVFLCFGAVHHEARVWVAGALVATHVGGHAPFEVDVTDHVRFGGSVPVVVRVWAPNDQRLIAHGKQRSLPPDDFDGVQFTPSSGIWQTVWLEPRAATFADLVALRGDSLEAIDAQVRLVGPHRAGASVRIAVSDGPEASVVTGEDGTASTSLPLASPRLWSPADPHLYQVTVTVDGPDGRDQVVSWVGLRRVARRAGYVELNGEPVYLRGVLDQGYWPGTGITAPSDEALVEDLRLAFDCGFNLVRKHIKLEEPRWLHHADRMGMLVWEEPPCTSRYDESIVDVIGDQLPVMVDRDGNHPSIVIWGLYNEEWGFDWAVDQQPVMQDAIRATRARLDALDTSRLVVDNSGWSHVDTDLLDWHLYVDDIATWSRWVAELANGERSALSMPLGPDWRVDKPLVVPGVTLAADTPLINSEYATGYTNYERAWQTRWQTQEMRRHDRIAGYIYCELTDIEHETAGIYYFDRLLKDHAGLRLADVHAPTTLVFDVEPVKPGVDVEADPAGRTVEVRVSHHGTQAVSGELVVAWLPAHAPLGELPPVAAAKADVVAEPYRVSDPVTVKVSSSPLGPWSRLGFWLVEPGASNAVARGFLDVGVVEPPVGLSATRGA
ncbi:hypothetical protein OEB99_15120 [Actinotalea sp. M2MS4P-6]|uniref:glycoside hydrolase family 2 protein n=1 Tax=Actinotalea sp. M2MS4P-6 TaxID=2983762 RepID=UPI0021E3C2A7|nr:sugar-binding domain-containing protein [Actinotalea sp. M2MS4P-6]MCV2395644.1 hypothetical protein [Actinotalea sp. M2MS4P-6]